MRRTISSMFAILTLSMAVGNPSRAEDARTFKESVFELQVPPGWSELPKETQENFKRSFEEQIKAQFREYHGGSIPYDALVPHVVGLESGDGKVLVWGVLSRIPEQATNYVDEMYARAKQMYEWGTRNGKLREVISIEKTTIDGVPAVRSKLVSTTGSHDTVIVYHFPENPSYGGSITVTVAPGSDEQRKKEAAEFIRTIGFDPAAVARK